jgi:hypothetical protein
MGTNFLALLVFTCIEDASRFLKTLHVAKSEKSQDRKGKLKIKH